MPNPDAAFVRAEALRNLEAHHLTADEAERVLATADSTIETLIDRYCDPGSSSVPEDLPRAVIAHLLQEPRARIRTPEQTAQFVIDHLGEESVDEHRSQARVRDMIVEAIWADRDQFFDTGSSVSRQHYIDAGRYLLHEEIVEKGDDLG